MRGLRGVGEEALEVRVPNPAHVRAVGRAIVEAEDRGGPVYAGEVFYGAVAACGVLDEHHRHARLAELEALHASEAALYVREALHGALGRDAEGQAGGDSRGGVIEVVHGGEADGGGINLAVYAHLDGAALGGEGVDAHDGHVRLRAGVAALGAAEAAQMRVGVEAVLVLRAADYAPGRVGDVAARAERGVDAEEAHAVGRVRGQRGDEGVVRVQADDGALRLLEAYAYALERVRDLAVAVELVAENVRDDDNLRLYLAADALEGRLVAFDNGRAAARSARERGVRAQVGGDAALEVRAGAVAMASTPLSESRFSIMRQVVVLPFVPVTTQQRISRESRATMSGQSLSASVPGRAVPPRPSRRSAQRESLQSSIARNNLIESGPISQRTIICSLSAPTETYFIGQPTASSQKFT